MAKEPDKLPEEPTYAQSIEFDPKEDPSLLAKSLAFGGLGTLGGGLYGLGKSILGGEDPFKGTLASALKGGLGTGATAAYALANPLQRGMVLGSAYESGLNKALQQMISGRGNAFGAATEGALESILSGRGRFTPEEKQSLIQQFTQSALPSSKGWQRRIKLGEQTARKLLGRNPSAALRGLKVMQTVMPDMDMRTAVQHAIDRITSGQLRTPVERMALSALGRRIYNRLNIYRQAAPQLKRLASLRKNYSTGGMRADEFAKRVGLLTGRFGGNREEVARMRQFLQEIIARPVGQDKSEIGKLYASNPEVASLMQLAMSRGGA